MNSTLLKPGNKVLHQIYSQAETATVEGWGRAIRLLNSLVKEALVDPEENYHLLCAITSRHLQWCYQHNIPVYYGVYSVKEDSGNLPILVHKRFQGRDQSGALGYITPPAKPVPGQRYGFLGWSTSKPDMTVGVIYKNDVFADFRTASVYLVEDQYFVVENQGNWIATITASLPEGYSIQFQPYQLCSKLNILTSLPKPPEFGDRLTQPQSIQIISYSSTPYLEVRSHQIPQATWPDWLITHVSAAE